MGQSARAETLLDSFYKRKLLLRFPSPRAGSGYGKRALSAVRSNRQSLLCLGESWRGDWDADPCGLHAPWGSLGRPWGSLGSPWGVFGVTWGVLGGSLGILWGLWGSLGGPWEVPGRSLKVPKGFWMHSEGVDPTNMLLFAMNSQGPPTARETQQRGPKGSLGGSGEVLGGPWVVLGCSLVLLGGSLGGLWGHLGGLRGVPGRPCGVLGGSLGVLGESLGGPWGSLGILGGQGFQNSANFFEK